ncbi:MAG: hypothetical protein ABH823_00020 [bacterium]
MSNVAWRTANAGVNRLIAWAWRNQTSKLLRTGESRIGLLGKLCKPEGIRPAFNNELLSLRAKIIEHIQTKGPTIELARAWYRHYNLIVDITEEVNNPAENAQDFELALPSSSGVDWGYFRDRLRSPADYATGPVDLAIVSFSDGQSQQTATIDYFYQDHTHGRIVFIINRDRPGESRGLIWQGEHLPDPAIVRAVMNKEIDRAKAYPVQRVGIFEYLTELASELNIIDTSYYGRLAKMSRLWPSKETKQKPNADTPGLSPR